MNDREYRVVDGIGEVWETTQPLSSVVVAEAWAAYSQHSEPLYGPFRVETRTVTDWRLAVTEEAKTP